MTPDQRRRGTQVLRARQSPARPRQRTRLIARLTAAGFAVGGTAHAVSLALLAWGITVYGPGYPAWRHAVMAIVDMLIVLIALRRPSWLAFALVAFALEQLIVNGMGPEPVLVFIAAVATAWERGLFSGRGSSPESTGGERPRAKAG